MAHATGPGEPAPAAAPAAAGSPVDFTSAHYLGLSHGSESLRWTHLTTGTPAALRRPAGAAALEAALGALTGAERALLLTSTLHAFVDLFGSAWRRPGTILVDEHAYPIARWGMALAERRGARVRSFRHLDAAALERRLRQIRERGAGTRAGAGEPWIVTDGFCPGCGRSAPLGVYASVACRFGARLIVDDTQAVGVFGRPAGAGAPYGLGGGGSIRRHGLERAEHVVLVASLAKAFGAPLAMVAGSASFVGELADRSETLVHCSPPAAPALAAAERALAVNAREGDFLRARLAARVSTLRAELAARGFLVRGGTFPMQRVPVSDAREAMALHAALRRRGVEAVVRRSRCNGEVSLTFVVTARHRLSELRGAAAALAAAASSRRGCGSGARGGTGAGATAGAYPGPGVDLHSNLEA
jgi:8-amino-7-oxononanoate synthase